MSFKDAFTHTVGIEGAYSNNPLDRGGPTKFGITQATARSFNYKGEMADLPLATAELIYRTNYWDKLRGDSIDEVSPALAAEIFDTGVNMGVGRAATFLQRCLSALNRNGKDYADVVIDGAIGPGTIAALRGLLTARGSEGISVLLILLNCLQGARYIDICEADKSQEPFLYGWAKRAKS